MAMESKLLKIMFIKAIFQKEINMEKEIKLLKKVADRKKVKKFAESTRRKINNLLLVKILKLLVYFQPLI